MKAYWGVELQLHAFLTSALNGSEWSASRPATLHPGKEPLVPIGQETGWAPEPVWTRWWIEKFPAPVGSGLEPPIIQPVARRYTIETCRYLKKTITV
jgi:hypothetical protein